MRTRVKAWFGHLLFLDWTIEMHYWWITSIDSANQKQSPFLNRFIISAFPLTS